MRDIPERHLIRLREIASKPCPHPKGSPGRVKWYAIREEVSLPIFNPLDSQTIYAKDEGGPVDIMVSRLEETISARTALMTFGTTFNTGHGQRRKGMGYPYADD